VACFHPLRAGRSVSSGKTSSKVVFGKSITPQMEILKLPCGQCIGCRLDRSLMWAQRLMHESRSHDTSCFVTLTYSDQNLPADGSLSVKHFQKFMKRLRKRVPITIKYFHCGEYSPRKDRPVGPFDPDYYIGEGQRPHYHAVIFGYDFPDKTLWTVRDGNRLYTSDLLLDCWGKGHVAIGNLTFESAAYVARYCIKKINGSWREKLNEAGLRPYERICPVTAEIREVLPEYATMSRGGRTGRGIGHDFFTKFHTDIYPQDHVIVNGYPQRPSRYYDDLFDEIDPESMEAVKEKRQKDRVKHEWNNTPERLEVRKTVKEAQLKMLKRGLIE